MELDSLGRIKPTTIISERDASGRIVGVKKSGGIWVICRGCGKEFRTRECKIRIGRGKYCSRKCMTEHDWIAPDVRARIGQSLTGRKSTSSTKFVKNDPRIMGVANPRWRGGNRDDINLLRSSSEYKEWSIKVKAKYNHTCLNCGTKSRVIEAHHIYPLRYYPEKGYDVENGITLCKSCHISIENRREGRNKYSPDESLTLKSLADGIL